MSTGLGYHLTGSQTLTAADDLIQITAPADAVLRLEKVVVTQRSQTSSEALQVIIQRASAAGTGGAIVPVPNHVGYPAAGSTPLENTSTNATLTGIPHVDEGWNVLAPFIWHPTPEERIYVSPSGVIVVRLPIAPAASMIFHYTVAFAELGG